MGRKSRTVPRRLGGKLKAVRERLDLSQTEMLALVKPDEDKSNRAVISEYERGAKAPGYTELLHYARLVKVSTDVLIDDTLELALDGEKGRSVTPADNRSTESECLVIKFPSKPLDIVDDVYLELLHRAPRRLRPYLTRNDFYRALVGAAIRDYRDCPEENQLLAHWQYLMKRVAADIENNDEKNNAPQPTDRAVN